MYLLLVGELISTEKFLPTSICSSTEVTLSPSIAFFPDTLQFLGRSLTMLHSDVDLATHNWRTIEISIFVLLHTM